MPLHNCKPKQLRTRTTAKPAAWRATLTYMVSTHSPEQIIELLRLSPLPGEGGMWAQTWIDAHGSGIYFLIRPHDPSHLHRLDGPELWHHYIGHSCRLLLLHPDGHITRPVLGTDLGAGERPCVAVPAGTWMAAETNGSYSLVGTTMAPAFNEGGFELGDSADLSSRYPSAADDIRRLSPHQ
jgi:predicted cupin superfamily sugar epimerase